MEWPANAYVVGYCRTCHGCIWSHQDVKSRAGVGLYHPRCWPYGDEGEAVNG